MCYCQLELGVVGRWNNRLQIGHRRNNCPCFRSKAHPLLARGRTCINGLTGVQQLRYRASAIPTTGHSLPYRITVYVHPYNTIPGLIPCLLLYLSTQNLSSLFLTPLYFHIYKVHTHHPCSQPFSPPTFIYTVPIIIAPNNTQFLYPCSPYHPCSHRWASLTQNLTS